MVVVVFVFVIARIARIAPTVGVRQRPEVPHVTQPDSKVLGHPLHRFNRSLKAHLPQGKLQVRPCWWTYGNTTIPAMTRATSAPPKDTDADH